MRRILTLFFVVVGLMAAVFAQDSDEIADLTSKGARISRAANGGRLTGPSNAGRVEIIASFLRGRHGAETASSLVLEGETRTARGPIHLRLRQQVAGLDVYGTYARATLTPAGELVSVIENLAPAGPALLPATIDYRDAMTTALQRRYPGGSTDLPEVSSAQNKVVFGRNGRFSENPSVTRVAVPLRNGQLRTGYLVETWDTANQLWHTIVNGNGRVLFEELRTASDNYFVFRNSPDRSAQTNESGPALGDPLSRLGWITSNTTIGNNVDAYLDRDANNAPDSNGRPVSASQNFSFTFDSTVSPTTNPNHLLAVTNLFYLNNVLHDKLYQHGFNEAAGNFQTDNFGQGGFGNDPVNAEAQDGSGTSNANFATPTDGSRPRMQMYLWTTASPSRDGDLDADIVYHEYGHGLTWRMIGAMSGPLAGAIGEGMSDTLAIYMNGDDRLAEYSANDTGGIRRYVYEAYPLKYGDVTGSSVHNDGEIYAGAMWKLRELWLGSGRTMDQLFDIVIDGMNSTPSRPAYEDMRDGILAAADSAAEDCLVWQAFAQAGIGEGADGTESCRGFRCSANVTESFAVPAACSTAPPPPPPGGFSLSSTGYKVRGVRHVDLTWSGAPGTSVDVWRGETKVATVNGTSHTDIIPGKGGGSFTYKVCGAGTSTCSNTVTVVF